MFIFAAWKAGTCLSMFRPAHHPDRWPYIGDWLELDHALGGRRSAHRPRWRAARDRRAARWAGPRPDTGRHGALPERAALLRNPISRSPVGPLGRRA